MTTEITICPACRRALQVPVSYFGQTVQCPECRHEFQANRHAEKVQSEPPPPAPPPVREDDDRPPPRPNDDFDDDDFDDIGRIRHSSVPHRGGAILAMGLLALVLFPYVTIVCGPMAWVMGNADLTEIRAGRMDPSGESLVQAGRVLGMIATILFLLGLGLLGGFISLVIMAG